MDFDKDTKVDHTVTLKEYLKTHSYLKNNKGTRKMLNMSSNQLKWAINRLLEEDVLTLFHSSPENKVYKVNRSQLSREERVTPTDEAVKKLNEYLKGKQQLKDIMVVARNLGISYNNMKKAVAQLEEEHIIMLACVFDNNHRVYHVNEKV